MESQRKIKAKKFLRDFRTGITLEDLMEKYHLSTTKLENVFERLMAAGVLDEEELKLHLPEPTVQSLIHALRSVRRCYPTFFVPVYDLDDLQAEGHLNDISEAGLSAAGIEAISGEEKRLIIGVNRLTGIAPFLIEAVCRWNKIKPDGKTVCGFEVTSWPTEVKDALPKLIESLTICDQQ